MKGGAHKLETPVYMFLTLLKNTNMKFKHIKSGAICELIKETKTHYRTMVISVPATAPKYIAVGLITMIGKNSIGVTYNIINIQTL